MLERPCILKLRWKQWLKTLHPISMAILVSLTFFPVILEDFFGRYLDLQIRLNILD